MWYYAALRGCAVLVLIVLLPACWAFLPKRAPLSILSHPKVLMPVTSASQWIGEHSAGKRQLFKLSARNTRSHHSELLEVPQYDMEDMIIDEIPSHFDSISVEVEGEVQPFDVDVLASTSPPDHHLHSEANVHKLQVTEEINGLVLPDLATIDELPALINEYGQKQRLADVFPQLGRWTGLLRNAGNLSPQSIALIVNSFQHCNIAKSMSVWEFMRELIEKLRVCEAEFSPKELEQLMVGISSTSSEADIAIELIDSITACFSSSHEKLGPYAAGCLYGLKSLFCGSASVKRLLSAITLRLGEGEGTLDATNIGYAMQGLANMHSSSKEVRKLLHVLSSQLVTGPPASTNQNVDKTQVESLHSPRISSISIYETLMGLQCMDSADVEVDKYLSKLSVLIGDSEEPIDAKLVCSGLQGLHKCRSASAGVLNLLRVINSKLKASINAFESAGDKYSRFSFYAYSEALFGLQGFSDEYSEVTELLDTLNGFSLASSHIDENIYPNYISRSLNGLERMSSENAVVRDSIRIISKNMLSSPQLRHNLTGNQLSTCLYGLKGMNCDSEEVRSLVALLTYQLNEAIKLKFNGATAGQSLLGLRRMDSDNICVRELIRALLPKLHHCFQPIRAQDIASCLYGMRNMSSNDDLIRQLLAEVYSSVIIPYKGPSLEPNAICNALRGMKRMSSDYSEVTNILAYLTKCTAECKYEFYLPSLCDGICSLSNMDSKQPHVSLLLQQLMKHLSRCRGTVPTNKLNASIRALSQMNRDGVRDATTEALIDVLNRKAAKRKSLEHD